jgi:hypothetical protein
MNRLLLAVLMLAGCEYYTLVPEPSDITEDCTPEEITSTRVKTARFGGSNMMLLCSNCDIDECSSLGARCDIEDAPCDFYGKLGVCRGCCDSEYGELHCALSGP